jgi:hypothetical protein
VCTLEHLGWQRLNTTPVRTQDIVVFDEESDRHVVIPWEDAVEASFCMLDQANANGMDGVWEEAKVLEGGSGMDSAEARAFYNSPLGAAGNAQINQAQGSVGKQGAKHGAHDDELSASEWRELANCWAFIARYGPGANHGAGAGFFPLDDAPAAGYIAGAGAPDDKFCIVDEYRGKSIARFMQVPAFRVYCVMTRPFIEHLMMSAVMTVSGRDTGAMLFGPSDMQISANTQVKTIEG